MKFYIFLIFVVVVSGFEPFDSEPESLHYNHNRNTTTGTWRRFNSSELEIFLQSIPKSLTHLGESADGKVIFIDTTVQVTWQEARTNCESMNLSLLQILTREQLDFACSAATSGDYWIGGRENRESERSIMWYKLDGQVPAHYKIWAHYLESQYPFQYCLKLITRSEYNGWLAGLPCTRKNWYLCEA